MTIFSVEPSHLRPRVVLRGGLVDAVSTVSREKKHPPKEEIQQMRRWCTYVLKVWCRNVRVILVWACGHGSMVVVQILVVDGVRKLTFPPIGRL